MANSAQLGNNDEFYFSYISFYYSPGPGPLTSIENTASNSTIRLIFKEPVEKNGEKITYNANVSFSYKLLCGKTSASAVNWQKVTNIKRFEVTFTNLQSYSVFKVRVWASTSAGGGPVMETLAYTKPGGKYYIFFCITIIL